MNQSTPHLELLDVPRPPVVAIPSPDLPSTPHHKRILEESVAWTEWLGDLVASWKQKWAADAAGKGGAETMKGALVGVEPPR